MKKEHLFSITKKDFDFDYFSGKGAGGQHRNRHKNCVRMLHRESGARAVGQSHREKNSNIREAFKNIIKNSKFKVWHNRKVYEVIEGKKIEDIVNENMKEENLKIEVRDGGKWKKMEV